jgi:hypothetical protein
MTVVYGFLAAIAAGLWGTLQALNLRVEDPKYGQPTSVPLAVCVCLVGYALLPFLPVVLFSMYPSDSIQWGLLLLACLYSSVVVVLELAPMLLASKTVDNPYGKFPVVGGAVAGLFAGFSFVLKVWFF